MKTQLDQALKRMGELEHQLANSAKQARGNDKRLPENLPPDDDDDDEEEEEEDPENYIVTPDGKTVSCIFNFIYISIYQSIFNFHIIDI